MQKLTNLIVDHPALTGLITALLIVVLGLFVYGFGDVRRFAPRRVWAIGGVVFRESIRRKVLWLTPIAMLGVIVISGLQRADDPQDAIRQTIQFCLFSSGFLVIVSGIMLACTNLPRDIESKVVFTIVTKPTTRLEIVLGKIVGFARVTGAILLLMGVFTWGYLHVRAWQLSNDTARQLAGPLDNEVARGRLEHQQAQGLLATRTLAYATSREIAARLPKGESDVRWASAKQNLLVPFHTTPEQLAPLGFNDAAKGEPLPPAGANGVDVLVSMQAEQIGKVERPQPVVRAPMIAPAAPASPYGDPEFRLSVIDLYADQEIVPAALLNGGKPIRFPLGASGRQMKIKLDSRAAAGLGNSRHWGLVFTPTNENYLIGIVPGSAQVVVLGSTPANDRGISPDAGPKNAMPTLIARGNSGRGGQLLDGPLENNVHPSAVYHFDGKTPAAAAGDTVTVEMEMGIERLNDDSSQDNTRVGLSVVNRKTGAASPAYPVYPENGKRVYADVPASFFDGGQFDVVLQTDTEGHAVTLSDAGVTVVQSRHSFGVNLFAALFSQWMLSILVVTIGFFCSTFVSWPIAIVLSVVILMGRWTVDQISDSLQPGIGATVATDTGLTDPTRARVVSATVDGLARTLNVLSQFLPNIDLFSTGNRIERGLSISPLTLVNGLVVLVLFGLPMFALAYVILRNKEVAP